MLWWRHHQSAKALTIIAGNINEHESEQLNGAIQKDAHDNDVVPRLSSFLKAAASGEDEGACLIRVETLRGRGAGMPVRHERRPPT